MGTEAVTPDLGVGSHAPILARAVACVPGRVLELGTGHGSTWLLHELCAGLGRPLLSADTSEEWLSKFQHLASPRHQFAHVGSWIPWVLGQSDIGVAFVDNAPGEMRVPIINLLKTRAALIVAHDTCADNPGAGGAYGWKKLDGVFKYQQVYQKVRPWTTLYSDSIQLPL